MLIHLIMWIFQSNLHALQCFYLLLGVYHILNLYYITPDMWIGFAQWIYLGVFFCISISANEEYYQLLMINDSQPSGLDVSSYTIEEIDSITSEYTLKNTVRSFLFVCACMYLSILFIYLFYFFHFIHFSFLLFWSINLFIVFQLTCCDQLRYLYWVIFQKHT